MSINWGIVILFVENLNYGLTIQLFLNELEEVYLLFYRDIHDLLLCLGKIPKLGNKAKKMIA